MFLRRTATDDVADNDPSGCDTQSNLKRNPFWAVQGLDRGNDLQRTSDSAFSIIFMGFGVTEVNQKPVPHISCNVTAEPIDDRCATALIVGDDIAQLFRIQGLGQGGRAHQIAEHDGQLPSFRFLIVALGRFLFSRFLSEGIAAPAAELSARRIGESAGRTLDRHRLPAFGTKPISVRVLRFTGRTFHVAVPLGSRLKKGAVLAKRDAWARIAGCMREEAGSVVGSVIV